MNGATIFSVELEDGEIITEFQHVSPGWECKKAVDGAWFKPGQPGVKMRSRVVVIARKCRPDPDEIIMVGLKRSTVEVYARREVGKDPGAIHDVLAACSAALEQLDG